MWLGLIPAHAGKTCHRSLINRLTGAHPRSRGENFWRGTARPHVRGSSPLTRGKPNSGSSGVVMMGLIPAHAGKTHLVDAGLLQARAHPRSRGENNPTCVGGSTTRGSSPLTRGKRDGGGRGVVGWGLIPAHAGKTARRPASRPRSWAHPRSRGENGGCQVFSGLGLGSSPLTRGKRGGVVGVKCLAGLIPAHAGKTLVATAAVDAVWAHPRSRGENLIVAVASRAAPGSSPLTRGKHHWMPPTVWAWGLIPAHAGKTATLAA